MAHACLLVLKFHVAPDAEGDEGSGYEVLYGGYPKCRRLP